MYYIYDNYNEEWCATAFADFEMAEKYMEYLMENINEEDYPNAFDIYEKITQLTKLTFREVRK